MSKLTKKLQVLLSEEEVATLNRIILNDAIERGIRPISMSAFIRELIRYEIDTRSEEDKTFRTRCGDRHIPWDQMDDRICSLLLIQISNISINVRISS